MARRAKVVPVITRVNIPTRPLVTLGVDHKVWRGEDAIVVTEGGAWDGAIVRLRPPPEADAQLVEAVRRDLTAAGAARVHVEVRRGVVLPAGTAKAPAPRSSARQVVAALVDEANTDDRDALRDLAERLMAEEGL